MNQAEFNNCLSTGLTKLGFNVQQSLLNKFWLYMEFLLAENKKYNLTGITEPEEIITKHFFDSLSLCVLDKINIKNSDYILDLGTGAGFPGLVLKIMFSDINIVLLDSTLKKVNFLILLISKLGIKNNIQVFHKRAEKLGKDINYRSSFDLVVSRAVAPLNILCEYTIPFVKNEGFAVYYKGPDYEQELGPAEEAISVLGGKIDSINKVKVPGLDGERYILVIKKVSSTPNNYPRRPGIPKKDPL